MISVDLNLDGGRLIITANVREAQYVKTIPGARIIKPEGNDIRFTAPATLAQGYALKAYGKDRVIFSLRAKALLNKQAQWAKEQEEIREGEPFYWPSGCVYLWDYQKAGTAFMLHGQSVLVADEMGSGKSIMGTALLDLVGGPSLVVATKSTLYWWEECITRYTTLKTSVVTGSAKQRLAALSVEADVYIIGHAVVAKHSSLSHFGAVPGRGDIGPLNRPWQVVILDEAHKIKDPKAQISRAMYDIGKTAERRIALTGTPIADSPDDLWSVMHFVAPDEWPSRTLFRERYCITHAPWYGGFEVLGLQPSTEPEMRKFLQPRIIRRLKAEVLPDIPAPLEPQYLLVELDPAQQQVYNSLVKQGMARLPCGSVLMPTETLYLHKLCDYVASGVPTVKEDGKVAAITRPSSKVTALLDVLESTVPVVVYAHSRKVIDFLEEVLTKEGYSVGKITGAVVAEARQAAINLFQAGELDVMLLTSAGAEGITLTRASTLVYFQQDWSAITNQQVGDRIHRPGQEKAVRRIILLAKGTIDEGRRFALDQKVEVQQEILKDKNALIKGVPT